MLIDNSQKPYPVLLPLVLGAGLVVWSALELELESSFFTGLGGMKDDDGLPAKILPALGLLKREFLGARFVSNKEPEASREEGFPKIVSCSELAVLKF